MITYEAWRDMPKQAEHIAFTFAIMLCVLEFLRFTGRKVFSGEQRGCVEDRVLVV